MTIEYPSENWKDYEILDSGRSELVGIDGHATSKDTYKEFTLNEAPALSSIVNAGLDEVRHIFTLTK